MNLFHRGLNMGKRGWEEPGGGRHMNKSVQVGNVPDIDGQRLQWLSWI